jgi:hypothetical protein
MWKEAPLEENRQITGDGLKNLSFSILLRPVSGNILVVRSSIHLVMNASLHFSFSSIEVGGHLRRDGPWV